MNKYKIKFKETSRESELEFYSNIFLSEKRIEFNKIEETSEFPLIQQIFYLPFIKKVILKSRKLLKIKGKLIIEIGHKQKNNSIQILKKNGFYVNKISKDLSGRDRCIISTKI